MTTNKNFRVVQIATSTHWDRTQTVRVTGMKDYRYHWQARLSAFFRKGESILGVTRYTAVLYNIADLDPEPWVSRYGADMQETRWAERPPRTQVYTQLDPRPDYYQDVHAYGEPNDD